MRDIVKSSGRRLRTGWFWPLMLLALPNCFLQTGGIGPPPVFDPGPGEHADAVMCDIPKLPAPGNPENCATGIEVGFGMPLAHAAVALVEGQNSSLALDFSPTALTACSQLPRKIEFQGAFPDGYSVCLNCGTQVGPTHKYSDTSAVCVDQCIDLVNYSEAQLPPNTTAEQFCTANAHVSTNFPKNDCFLGACSNGGLRPDFVDPRRNQEPVKWTDTQGTSPTDNTLTRIAPTTDNFDAGAASEQLIMTGDGWVEFEADDTTMGHALGLSHVPILLNGPPPDDDPTLADIQFAIVLDSDKNVYIFESGTKVPGPGPNGSIEPYTAGERFRVNVKDNNDLLPHTATITYLKLTAPCTPGTVCATLQIATQTAPSPSYPLRVDASLKEVGATLTNVTLVRIQ